MYLYYTWPLLNKSWLHMLLQRFKLYYYLSSYKAVDIGQKQQLNEMIFCHNMPTWQNRKCAVGYTKIFSENFICQFKQKVVAELMLIKHF